jgi:REP element-mobilizing transposase RayT
MSLKNHKNNLQLSLIPQQDLRFVKAMSFGGSKLKKRRKVERPLIPGAIHHVVLKSSKAVGKLSFYHNKNFTTALLKERSKKYFIEIIQWVNMGNHLHLKVRFKSRQNFQNFLRTFTAILARKITGAHRSKSFGRFWDGLAFTRIITTKFEELGLRAYFEANHRQRELGYAARTEYLKSFNQFLYRLKTKRAKSVNLQKIQLSC